MTGKSLKRGIKMAKCWRCGEAVPSVSDPLMVIPCKPHELPGLDIKIRVPANICQSCIYALKLAMETSCQIVKLRKRIAREG